MIIPENGPSAERKLKPKRAKRAKRKPEEKPLKMDAPGPTPHSSVANNPSGISREASQEERKPITNQDEQEVITNQDQSSQDAEKN